MDLGKAASILARTFLDEVPDAFNLPPWERLPMRSRLGEHAVRRVEAEVGVPIEVLILALATGGCPVYGRRWETLLAVERLRWVQRRNRKP